MPKAKVPNRYAAIIERVFLQKYVSSSEVVGFDRDEFAQIAAELGVDLPKNLGDVVYSFRYRAELPASIRSTAKRGHEWVIEGVSRAKYRFAQVKISRITPRQNLAAIKIPDSTPEIVLANRLGDEQALLARIRYNRLIDVFLGITAYPLQSHLRTQLKSSVQIEIDEIYVGIDRNGRQFIVPVQAKGKKDKHGSVQTKQDLEFCEQAFPSLICRAISAQFLEDDRIVMFELCLEKGEVSVVEEKHYVLVPASEITTDDLNRYSNRA
jgi:hypothetical protein